MKKLGLKPELFISILSLVGTILLGLYLNNRNEKFQKELLELRNKADLANIALNYENGLFSAYNLGPATANDFKLVICLFSVGSQWSGVIEDISDLDVSIDNLALDNSTQIKKGVCQSKLTNNDAFQINIKSLPPQQSVQVRINQAVGIPVSEAKGVVDVYVQTSETALIGKNIGSTEISPPLRIALDQYVANNAFKMADIEVNMACANCNLDRKQYTLSSSSNKNYLPSIKIIRSGNTAKAHIVFISDYFLPSDAIQEPIKDIYLNADHNITGDIRLVNVSNFEFAMATPTGIPSIETAMPPKVTLVDLQNGQRVTCLQSINGTYPFGLEEDIWPVIYIGNLYFPQSEDGKAAQKVDGRWYQTVYFGDCEDQAEDVGKAYQLIIVTANESANAAFEDYFWEGHTGMIELPPGVEVQVQIVVFGD